MSRDSQSPDSLDRSDRSGGPSSRSTRVILASRSPQRREILARLGVDFEVVSPEVEETAGGDPLDDVLDNARMKARAVAGRLEASDRDALVIACDTDVVLDRSLLGKPEDRAHARDYLRRLSGRTHEVLSGLCVIEAGVEREGFERSRVTFKELTPSEIDAYLDSEEWRGRAGGYAVQGRGSGLVARVEGDVSNVIGLPVPVLARLVPRLGRSRTT